MKIIKAISCTCALLLSAPVFAETTLRVATWLPASSSQNDVVWPTWADWVEEATDGRVKI